MKKQFKHSFITVITFLIVGVVLFFQVPSVTVNAYSEESEENTAITPMNDKPSKGVELL